MWDFIGSYTKKSRETSTSRAANGRKEFVFLLPELFLSTQLLPVPHIIIITVSNDDRFKNKFLKVDLLISLIKQFDQPSLACRQM
jgi:hypothetical protein